MKQEELIPLSEAAHIAGMTPDHLRFLARKGSLKAKKVGRDWLTTEQAVIEYLRDSHKRSRDPRKRMR